MTYSPLIMQGLSFFQHMGEIFKMDKVIDVIGKTLLSCLLGTYFRYYNCQVELN